MYISDKKSTLTEVNRIDPKSSPKKKIPKTPQTRIVHASLSSQPKVLPKGSSQLNATSPFMSRVIDLEHQKQSNKCASLPSSWPATDSSVENSSDAVVPPSEIIQECVVSKASIPAVDIGNGVEELGIEGGNVDVIDETQPATLAADDYEADPIDICESDP